MLANRPVGEKNVDDAEISGAQNRQQLSITENHLLSTFEAAAYLALKPATLEKWRSAGSGGPCYARMGHAIRYRRVDLDDYVAANVTAPGEARP